MISFASPAREHAATREALEEAVLRVLRSGAYVLGPEVDAFERDLAGYTKAAFAVGVSSGTDALVCALHALGIGHGDEVIVPAYGFVAAPEAVVRVGARPVFVDVEPATLGPELEELRCALGPRTRALVVMHLFGQAVDLQPLRAAIGKLPIIEDSAQAIGTFRDGRHVGSVAEVGTMSFFPAKALGAAGDAGAVLTSDPEIAAKVKRARVHGSPRAYVWEEPGGNYRIDALQAALLRAKLQAFPERIARRRSIGLRLARIVRDAGASVLDGGGACIPTFAPFAMRVAERDRVAARLRELGIDARVQYPCTLPGSRAFAPLAGSHAYPEADRASRELLSIPCHAELTDDEVAELERALSQVMANG